MEHFLIYVMIVYMVVTWVLYMAPLAIAFW